MAEGGVIDRATEEISGCNNLVSSLFSVILFVLSPLGKYSIKSASSIGATMIAKNV
jgi:hypothetical protein